MLDGNLKWENGGGDLAMYPEFTHFGFRHLTEEGYHYGWARIYVESINRVCVDRYAYWEEANYPLRWGQTSMTGIEENDASAAFATLHPNPTTGLVAIAGEKLKAAETFNALGQRVATATGKGEQLQIDLSGLPAGVYFVNITDSEGRRCVRKMVKE